NVASAVVGHGVVLPGARSVCLDQAPSAPTLLSRNRAGQAHVVVIDRRGVVGKKVERLNLVQSGATNAALPGMGAEKLAVVELRHPVGIQIDLAPNLHPLVLDHGEGPAPAQDINDLAAI